MAPRKEKTSLESACARCKDNCCKWGPLILLPGEWKRIRQLKHTESRELDERIDRAEAKLVDRDGLQILDKVPGEPCPFLTENERCSIYSHRPRDCRIWPLYYPSTSGSGALTIGSRCPAVGGPDLTPQFLESASSELTETPTKLWPVLHKATVDAKYELRELQMQDLPAGSLEQVHFAHLRREMLLILLSVLFGFAVIEITKTFLSLLPWIALGVQRPQIGLALLILMYFILNSVRYVWSHMKLSAYVPLITTTRRQGRLLVFLHDLMFPLEAMLFVAMALILTIPGVPLFSSLPPEPVKHDLLARYFDTLVAGFIFLNLILASVDLGWCKLMKHLMFLGPDSATIENPPDLDSWRNSSAEEVILFSFSAVLLLIATKLSLKDLFPHGGVLALFIIVGLPWITLLREFRENLMVTRG